jgi:hypothetical protein
MTSRAIRRGLTLTETIVLLALGATAVAVAVPPLTTVGCSSARTVSRNNLAALAASHVAYAGDFAGRQFTMVPDNLGAFGGCQGYLDAGNCLDGASLGITCDGSPFAPPIGCGAKGDCAAAINIVPMQFATDPFGAHRLPNAAGFQPYVGGRFHDPTFYAPDDVSTYDLAAPWFGVDCGYAAPIESAIAYSSYVLSPAAMFDPKVLGRLEGFRDPDTLSYGYRSPGLAVANHPSLKSHMIELNAVELTFAPCNPAASGDGGDCVPYRFNQVWEARPLALMYDGSVRLLTPRAAQFADQRVRRASQGMALTEKGLWVRGTPLGANGVGGAEAADFMVDTNYHWLTSDGILGRDVLE